MNLNKRIRIAIGRYLFKNKLKGIKRKSAVISLADARKIGILYNATNMKHYELVKQYVKDLRTRFQKDVLALGFVDKKELPPMQFAKLGLDFFTKTSLNWHMIPHHPIVNNFINSDFDILISLNTEKCFPLQYVAAFSKARFRIGIFDGTNTSSFDMMIDTGDDKSLKNLISHINHYLHKIQT
jgi:hypothetical protein